MPEILFQSRAHKLPNRCLKIYRLAPSRVDRQTLLATAKQLGLRADAKGGIFQEDAARLLYSEGTLDLFLYRASGAIQFRDRTRYEIDDGHSQVEYSDQRAMEIARGFIKQKGLASLKELELLKVAHLHVAHLERETGKSEERIIGTSVAFQRIVDGIPVDGPGGKLIVHIDAKGEVAGVDRIWRKLQRVLRPVESLQTSEFLEESFLQFIRRYGDTQVIVQEFRFGYFEEGLRQAQQILQPAFIIFILRTSTDERFRKKSVFVLPAATNHAGPIMPPSKPARRITPRT